MIGLIAKLKVQDGKGPALEKAFAPLSVIVNSDTEPGNLLYKLCKSRSDPDTYVVMELYRDQAAVDEHPRPNTSPNSSRPCASAWSRARPTSNSWIR